MSCPFSTRFFLIVILGFWRCDSYAQKLPLIQIDITATNAFKGTYLFMSIYNFGDSTKIVYKTKDSLDNKGLKSDTQYMALQGFSGKFLEAQKNEDSVLKIMRKFVEISQRHTYYSKDSIFFNNHDNASYTKLLNKVINTNTSTLESLPSKNTNIILDGTHFVFVIKAPNQNRRVFADSPTQKSYPILYDLLHQTTELYRKRKNNTFLTTAKTDGY